MIQSFLRRMPFQHITSIAFLFIMAAVLATGLGQVVRGAQLTAFMPVGMVAAVLGWGLGSRRLNGGWIWVGMVLTGAVWLWASTAQFGGPVLQMATSIFDIVQQPFTWVWNRKLIIDFSVIASAYTDLLTQSTGLWLRIVFWAKAMQAGENRYDAVIYVLFWSGLLWLVVTWAGWFMRREQVLSATIPSLALLAEVFYITNADITPLWAMLSITLLLMGLTHFRLIFTGWLTRGVDYAEIIFDGTISSIILTVLLLISMAWVTPSMSVKQIVDTIREYSIPAKPGNSLAETLGLQANLLPQKQAALDKTRLPSSHLISSGPKLSRDLVMTISTGELPPSQAIQMLHVAPYHRWRSYTLDRYINVGWGNDSVESLSYLADAPVFSQIPAGYRKLNQSIQLAAKSGGKVYWDGVLLTVDQPFEASWRNKPQPNAPVSDTPFNDADMFAAVAPAESYQVTSLIPTLDVDQLRAAPGTYPATIRNRYTALPANVPERVLALARQITSTAPTPYDQALAIESYLRKNYPYTLDVAAPPQDRDVADYFLFDLKKGFCDYYATSMVVMARAVGLPSRIVFGYASGGYDPASATYRVVKADAHAWVEVYFPKIGWVEFDPTANQPLVNRPTQNETTENASNTSQPGSFGAWLTWLQAYAPGFAGWGGLGLTALLILIVLLQTAEFILLANLPATRAMKIIYRGLYRSAKIISGAKTAGETPSEFSATLHAQFQAIAQKKGLQKPFTQATRELNLLTALYQQAIYTPYTPEKQEIIHAVRAWQTLRWRLLFAALLPKRKA